MTGSLITGSVSHHALPRICIRCRSVLPLSVGRRREGKSMKKLLFIPAIAALGMGAALLTTTSASAQPFSQVPLLQTVLADKAKSGSTQQGAPHVIEVQSRRRLRRNRRLQRRSFRRSRRSRRIRRRNRAIGAGIAGAIIGGAIIANERARAEERRRDRRARRGELHIDWCFDRYRSYRVRDNTYQPFNGRRRQCISPYY